MQFSYLVTRILMTQPGQPSRLRAVAVLLHLGEEYAGTWVVKFSFSRFSRHLRGCEKEKLRSDDQEQEGASGGSPQGSTSVRLTVVNPVVV